MTWERLPSECTSIISGLQDQAWVGPAWIEVVDGMCGNGSVSRIDQ